MKESSPRRLHSGHFAFMRALAQGLDERTSWERYLRLEGEHSDARTVRRTVAWIRDAFAAAARREQRPGVARLILLDPVHFPAAEEARPSLAEFAEAQGLADFSEDEQIEAYAQAYPSVPGRGGRTGGAGAVGQSRRARIIERQLEALHWLEGLVARDPRPGDPVAAWLNPAMATRLEQAGLPTLFELVARINGVGARWWTAVPGIGEAKARRVLEWLRTNESVLGGLRVGRHAAVPRMQLRPEDLAGVVSPATALLPFEKFIVPGHLDGRAGCFRGQPDSGSIQAADDRSAITLWLADKAKGGGARTSVPKRGGKGGEVATILTATQRAYRKEAERLLLWAVLERQRALSSLGPADAAAYAAFLRAPPASWCGPRHHPRWSPLWRPLEGPLNAGTLRQALTIVRSLFAFLVTHDYVTANPFADQVIPPAGPCVDTARSLNDAQWTLVESRLEADGAGEPARRLRRAIRWLYATGARKMELAAATCGDLERIAPGGKPDAGTWSWAVLGRGGRRRRVPVPADLIEELEAELGRQGHEPRVDAESNRRVHLLSRFPSAGAPPLPWSTSGLHQAVKTFFARTAQALGPDAARELRMASAHWLRHTHGAHALRGWGGPPLPVEILQDRMGHASMTTTALYRRVK
ncbi:phage integrase family protein [Variovorax sp. J22P168]|uniref:phage integrase family protein n=1 Tax=Variovorax jilinensis TaxID=3053513 RepID=UPI002574FFE5|nr:phage integrase family protein [Variovorax sp. J22P168]MDM0015860.1 phage integrase family protein [Variovorax sp. J22P168]